MAGRTKGTPESSGTGTETVNGWAMQLGGHARIAMGAAAVFAFGALQTTGEAQGLDEKIEPSRPARTTAVPGVQAKPQSPQGKQPAHRRVSVIVKDSSIRWALEAVTRSAGLRLSIHGANDRLKKPITVAFDNRDAMDAIATLLNGTGFTAKLASDGLTVMIRWDSTSSSRPPRSATRIRGVVTDKTTGKPIGAAQIVVGDGASRVVTDSDGRYQVVDILPGTYTVEVRRIGYMSARNSVVVTETGDVTVDFALVASATQLNEVVTTATGNQKRYEIGNSVASINVDSLIKASSVKNLTDVLDAGRIPGLIVSRSSGAPGAPARVRIRGIGSLNATNDPILIVDGVRVYSEQTTTAEDANYSVLDRFDINTIETLEVMKGPSASALYGSDAANGIIIITTKRGVPGPARWTVSVDQQRTTQPGSFAALYYREGAPAVGGLPIRCPLGNACTDPAVTRYNYLADPRTTVFGTGNRRSYSANVSGGAQNIQYFLAGVTTADRGLLKMSDADVAWLETTSGRPVPGWQRKPQQSSQLGGTSRITMEVTTRIRVGLTTGLNRSLRTTNPLEDAVGVLQRATPADSSLVRGVILDFRRRDEYRDLRASSAVNGQWAPVPWWTVDGDGGIETLNRRETGLLKRDDCAPFSNESKPSIPLCQGELKTIRNERSVVSGNLRSTILLPGYASIRATPSFGLNYARTTTADAQMTASGLQIGASTFAGADTIRGTEKNAEAILFGMFLSTRLSLLNERIFTSFGTRIDASNALGAEIRPMYPKLDLSYLVSRESWFPWSAVSLRVRLAYGHSAVQPDAGEQLRTYLPGISMVNGDVVPTLRLRTMGNPQLRPERTTEIEGGIDLGVLNDRVTVTVTPYRRLSKDALIQTYLPCSVGGCGLLAGLTTNLGSVKNAGLETGVDAVVIDRGTFRWSVNATAYGNRNRLVSVTRDFDQKVHGLDGIGTSGSPPFGQRFVKGYPLYGLWIKKISAWDDIDRDGVVSANEIVQADSFTYVGNPEPKFSGSFGTSVSLLNNRLTISSNGSYEGGKAQANLAGYKNSRGEGVSGGKYGLRNFNTSIRELNDPTIPLERQAAVRSGYAFVHTVSVFRLNSLSLRYHLSAGMARRFGARSMSLAMQGSNLALWTNYSSVDPNVNDTVQGNAVSDSGQLPTPRTWGINVSLSY